MKDDKRGITLIALVITIVVMLILAIVTINLTLGENGIIKRARAARDENEKVNATESMNLKITNVQMKKYAEEQKMPTLKELAIVLEKDDDIQYVNLESNQVASLTDVDFSNVEHIFTKLKEYPYEFEIDNQLRLASINGVKLAKEEISYNNKLHTKIKVDSKTKSTITVSVVNDTGLNIKNVEYFLNDKSVYSGEETTYTYSNLDNSSTYKLEAMAEYEDVEIALNEKPSNFETLIVDYWPLINSLNNRVNSSSTGALNVSNSAATYEPTGGLILNKSGYAGPYAYTSSNYALPNKYTIAVQVKLNKIPDYNWNYIVSLPTGGIHFGVQSDRTLLYSNNGNHSIYSNKTLNINQWYTLSITNDGSKTRYYVDGQLCVEVNSFSVSNKKLVLGGSISTSTYNGTDASYKNLIVCNDVADYNSMVEFFQDNN